MEGILFKYLQKSRFHLTDGHGREEGKFIFNLSRSACGKRHLADEENAAVYMG